LDFFDEGWVSNRVMIGPLLPKYNEYLSFSYELYQMGEVDAEESTSYNEWVRRRFGQLEIQLAGGEYA